MAEAFQNAGSSVLRISPAVLVLEGISILSAEPLNVEALTSIVYLR